MDDKNIFKDGHKNNLTQEGLIGLIKAIKLYSSSSSTSFNTFSNTCIRREIVTNIKKPLLELSSPEEILLSKEFLKDFLKNIKINFNDLEKKVFINICKGCTDIEISTILNITFKEIDNIIQKIRKKILKYLQDYTSGGK